MHSVGVRSQELGTFWATENIDLDMRLASQVPEFSFLAGIRSEESESISFVIVNSCRLSTHIYHSCPAKVPDICQDFLSTLLIVHRQ